jgi:hypothetical protein
MQRPHGAGVLWGRGSKPPLTPRAGWVRQGQVPVLLESILALEYQALHHDPNRRSRACAAHQGHTYPLGRYGPVAGCRYPHAPIPTTPHVCDDRAVGSWRLPKPFTQRCRSAMAQSRDTSGYLQSFHSIHGLSHTTRHLREVQAVGASGSCLRWKHYHGGGASRAWHTYSLHEAPPSPPSLMHDPVDPCPCRAPSDGAAGVLIHLPLICFWRCPSGRGPLNRWQRRLVMR